MSHGHKKVVCRNCERVVMQCRCAGPKPTVYIDYCSACIVEKERT